MNNMKKKEYIIKDSGERSKFDTGAVRDLGAGKGRFDLVPMATLRALAIHYEAGCKKYGARNWEKGIPVSRYLDSAMRHLTQVIDGRDDEQHLMATIWNLFCANETILRIQKGELSVDLYDMPKKVKVLDPYE